MVYTNEGELFINFTPLNLQIKSSDRNEIISFQHNWNLITDDKFLNRITLKGKWENTLKLSIESIDKAIKIKN